MCVCSLSYRACNAHAPYCHLWPAPLYNVFPHYLTNGTILEKNKLLNIKCVFWFFLQLLSEIFLILRRTLRDVIKIYVGLHVKHRLLLSYCNETWIFDRFSKTNQISNFTKIRPVGAELFHADRRTKMTNLITASHNFANASKTPFTCRESNKDSSVSSLEHSHYTDRAILIVAFRNFANAFKTLFICRESNKDSSVSSLEHSHYTDRAILIVAFRNFANAFKTPFICRESNKDSSVSSLEHNHYTDRAILIVAFRNFANASKTFFICRESNKDSSVSSLEQNHYTDRAILIFAFRNFANAFKTPFIRRESNKDSSVSSLEHSHYTDRAILTPEALLSSF